MKTIIFLLSFFYVNALSSQILNAQPSILYGKKYYLDNERISKKEFVNLISQNRDAGELLWKVEEDEL